MPFQFFDIAVLLLLLVFGLWGARRGFVLSLCGLVAVLVAVVGAFFLSRYLSPLIAQWLTPVLSTSFEEFFQSGGDASTGFLWHLMEKALSTTLPDAAASDPSALTSAGALAGVAAQWVAQAVSFSVAFFLILLGWTLLSHGLDLVTKLPGLNLLNKTAGLLLGLVKGAVVLFVGAWVLKLLGTPVPETALTETVLFRFFMTADPLLLLLHL
ncbi:MAG: CvpA family protein [Pseudoflavonifractor sp.]